MKTPLYNTLEAYTGRGMARFHMPGHKGKLPSPLDRAAFFDITEVMGADSLYEADGAIAETERMYSELYGSAASFLSAGGSTLCIQAMLALALKPGDRLICVRGAHSSAINAFALLDIEPIWVWPGIDGGTGLALAADAQAIARALKENSGVGAVYITSPDYFGVMADIAAVSRVCLEHGAALLVDNAHGAHLRFLPKSMHPINLGADMCADSLHKTLPALTGGALLHIGNMRFAGDAKRRMAMFGSTSPSYLIMLSCDMALPWIRDSAEEDIKKVCCKLSELRELAASRGFSIPAGTLDPMKLSLGFSRMGYTKDEFGAYVRENGAEPEFIGGGFCVFMASPGNTDNDFAALERIISSLPRRAALPVSTAEIPTPERVMSVREAAFARTETLPAEKCAGRTASAAITPCPPGIPIIAPGEKITEYTTAALKNCGVFHINVVK